MECFRCHGWPCECRDNITLIHGDNCDVMGQLPKESVDLVVTSPPYDDLRTYGGHSWDFYGVAWQLKRVLKPGGVIVWVVGDQTDGGSESGNSMRQALHFKDIGFNLHDTMVYQFAGTGAKGSNLAYWQGFEYMFVLSMGTPKAVTRLADHRNVKAGSRNGHVGKYANGTRAERGIRITPDFSVRDNVWRYGGTVGDHTQHPAQFPEKLARDHILSWSNEGDTVLDPFNGSGTTTKMAKLTGRKGIGIEVNEDYLPIAANRLKQEVLQFTD